MDGERSSIPKRSEVPCCLSYGVKTLYSRSEPLEICADCPHIDVYSYINWVARRQVYKIVPENRRDQHRKI